MSSPESVSSRMASRGSSSDSWRTSLRFFSPPENPALTDRLRRAGSISRRAMCSLARARNSMAPISGCAALASQGVQRRAEEVHVADAGDLDRVLEGEKEPRRRPLLGGHAEQVDTVERDRAGHVVPFPPGQDVGQRALARPVGAHHGVDLPGADGEVEPAQDARSAHRGGQALDAQHQPTAPSRLRRINACASTAYSMGSSSKTSRQNPPTIIDVASSSVRPRCRQ